VVRTTLKDRLSHAGTARNDLIDLMIKAMKDEVGKDDDQEKIEDQFDADAELQNVSKAKKKELDEVTIVATAMLMLIAG
jgi:hypothetical protein